MFRFSLATVLIVVAVFATVLSGLTYSNFLWLRIIGTMTLAVLIIASITSIAWQQPSRWFWVGFAVAGWIYLALAFYGDNEARDKLLTQYTVSQLDRMLETSKPTLTPAGELVVLYRDGRILVDYGIPMSPEQAEKQGYLKYAYIPSTVPGMEHFYDIGHYAWALLLGCFGGMLSQQLYRKSTAAAC